MMAGLSGLTRTGGQPHYQLPMDKSDSLMIEGNEELIMRLLFILGAYIVNATVGSYLKYVCANMVTVAYEISTKNRTSDVLDQVVRGA
jgi:hypothetical protein